ncbi:unnamed protein product [Symbiodinium sp. CCMP2456]|nr:unnamed protein product [Symbiodinium sp. CCMP2456]
MVGKRISLEKNLLNAGKQELSANLERTALCSFFAMGKCLRGKECKFAHDMTQIRPKPDLTRTSLCHDFMRKGSCKSGSKCKYAHGEAQLRGPKGEQKKPLAAAPAAVVEPLLWDPMGLELEAPQGQGVKEPLAPMDALIPVLQRLMGKRQTRPKSPQSPPTPVSEEKKAETKTARYCQIPNDKECGSPLPESLSSHPFKVVLRADGQITCAEAVDVYPVLPKDLAFPIHVKNTFLDFDSEIPPCDFIRFCTEPADLGRGAVSVAKSMIRELVERAADIKDPKEKREALDQIVLLSESSQSLASSVAPDVEVGTPVYDGPLRYKTLEQMFDVYLDGVMEGVQQQTKAMMQAFSGGEDASGAQPSVAEMTARAEQADKAQTTLAAIFKISEGKVQKLLDKKGEKMQKDLLGGLLSGEA